MSFFMVPPLLEKATTTYVMKQVSWLVLRAILTVAAQRRTFTVFHLYALASGLAGHLISYVLVATNVADASIIRLIIGCQ